MPSHPRFGLELAEAVLGDRVGQGVSGHVFRAKHARTGEPMAVKIYPLDGADPAFRAEDRFWRECRILSVVLHPAFPALYGCGATDDRNGYALMEWIEGRPLDVYRTAPVDDVLRLALKLLLGLRALHRKGFVHRDIAFDNVLVEERLSGPAPRIIDLGAAKDLSEKREVTHPGSFLGRVRFAPPESLTARGSAAVADPRADVFAFGVLLYEWLSGRPPFPGENPGDVLRSQQKKVPALALPRGRGQADAELSAYVLALLEKDVAARPTTEEAVARLLEIRRRRPARPVVLRSAPEDLVVEAAPAQFLLRPFNGRAQPTLERADTVDVEHWSGVATPSHHALAAFALPAEPSGDVPPPESVPLDGEPVRLTKMVEEVAKHPGGANLIMAFGILAFLAACALAFFLVFRR